MAPSTKGSCLCEDIQFVITGEPENTFICYCTHCSKNAGASGQISAKVRKEQVEIKQGEELLKTWVLKDNLSGHEKHKKFCSQCGCTMWTIPQKHGGSHLIVRTALLEDGLRLFPYKMEFFASKKLELAADSVKTFATMPGY